MGVCRVSYCKVREGLSFENLKYLELLLRKIREELTELVKLTEEDSEAPFRKLPDLRVGANELRFWQFHFVLKQDGQTRRGEGRTLSILLGGPDPIPYFGEAQAFTLSIGDGKSSGQVMDALNIALIKAGLVDVIAYNPCDSLDDVIWLYRSEGNEVSPSEDSNTQEVSDE